MFTSTMRETAPFRFPEFTGVRVQMMPFRMDDPDSLPDALAGYRDPVFDLVSMPGVGFLTVDEQIVGGRTQRRPGIHVDGPVWGGGRPRPPGWPGRHGMYLAATHVGCRAWVQDVDGLPGEHGECDHLAEQLEDPVTLEPNTAYWMDRKTVHEPLVIEETVPRQFVRISTPSDAEWFSNYTWNPTGVLPEGPIIGPRPARFMAGLS